MKTFVVLGMHRSATSFIAGAMHHEGIHMGDKILGQMGQQPGPHWENVEFMRLNNRILKAAGGSWSNPPPEEKILALEPKFRMSISKAVRKAGNGKTYWGFKDPRTTLTIRLYVKHLVCPHFICCFREPSQVAKSLHRRSKIPIQRCLELARIYNMRMLCFLADFADVK